MLSYLILAIVVSPILGKIEIVFPQHTTGDWKRVPHEYNYCPTSADKNSHGTQTGIPIELTMPKGLTTHQVDGFMCHSALWMTTCDFRWYGPKYITHSIHNEEPTDYQCLEAIKAYKDGVSFNPGFPPQSCGYGTVTDAEAHIITVTPHSVKVDEYTGEWIDPHFIGGRCKGKICETVHNSTKWFTSSDGESVCSQLFTLVGGTFFSDSEEITSMGLPETGIRSNYFPYISTEGICKMPFCRKPGYKLKNDLWFQITDPDLDKTVRDLPHIKDCDLSSSIITPGEHATDISLISDVERILDYALCQNTWSKIEAGEPITPVDLSYLGPKNPGVGPVFTIINGSLHYFTSKYLRVELESPVIPRMEGRVAGTRIVRQLWDQWFPFGEAEIGPNGVLKTKQGYKFPLHIIGTGEVDSDIKMERIVKHWEHPHIEAAQTFLKKDDTEEVIYYGDTGVSKNPVELVEGWFSGWRSSIMGVLAVIIGFVLLIFLIRLIGVLSSLFRPKRRPIYKSDVEMAHFR
uniref:Glycoprotein n=4 Tax=Vesicular stomatitis New Jersey virus TaxID=11280 RepID=A0A222ZFZ7_9RHAB|nr:glycoprotein [Vesicular stomatitis New Jersey virus]